MAIKRGLGKGLDALFVDNEIENTKEEIINISQIEPNKEQPRKNFDVDNLTELAESIRLYGVIQPILVRPLTNGNYQIVAGERRWRASRIVGLSQIPVIVKEMSDNDVMKIALVENLQRQDLNPIEEALGYKSLIDEFSLTQEEVSKSIGKARSVIANSIRILNLPPEVVSLISKGEISKGHAKVLLSLSDTDIILDISKMIIEKQLSVRQLEQIVKSCNKPKIENDSNKKYKTFFVETELSLKDKLGTSVRIKQGKSKCVLEIDFYSDEELSKILENF